MATTIFHKEHLGVVGNGFAGLTSALKLAMQGFRVSVLSRRDDKLKASCSAQGVSTIKGLLEADQELFSLKMLGHQQFLTWLKAVEDLSEIKIPCIKGVYENFLSKDHFSFEQHRAYKSRFLGAFAVEKVKKSDIDVFEKSFYLQFYPEDFWIDPDVYLRALNLACAKIGVFVFEDFDLSSIALNQNRVFLESKNGNKLSFNRIILATGSGTKQLLTDLDSQGICVSNQYELAFVSGYTMKAIDRFNRPNLALVKELSAVSYYNGDLMVGSTSDSHSHLPDIQEVPRPDLKQMFENLLNKSGIKFGNIDMDHLEFRWGVRVRGKSRLPIVKFLDSQNRIILNTGYYKSGITLSPLFATKIVDLIMSSRP